MNTKKQKVCAIMGVVLGVGCCFSLQAPDSKKPKKEQLSSSVSQPKVPANSSVITSSSSRFASDMKLGVGSSASSAAVPSSSSLSVDSAKQDVEQTSTQKKVQQVAKVLTEEGREKGLNQLLEHLQQEAANCTEVNSATVDAMFAPNTVLGYIEHEAGTKFYDSKEKFLAAGVARANKEKKLRVADILSIRRWERKQQQDQEMPTSIDELLKKQRSDRYLVFFHAASKKLKKLSSASNDNGELVKMQKITKDEIEVDLQKLKREDKKFDANKLYNDVLGFARKSKSSPEIMLYFSALVKPAEQPPVQEVPVKKKKGGWLG